MNKITQKSIAEIRSDEQFIINIIYELNSIINDELLKSNDEIDWKLIEDCTDALIYLNGSEIRESELTLLSVKKFKRQYMLSKMLKGSGAAAAAVFTGLLCYGIINSSNEPSIAPKSTSVLQITTSAVSEEKTTIAATTQTSTSVSEKSTSQKRNNIKQEKTTKKKSSERKSEKNKQSSETISDTTESDMPGKNNETSTQAEETTIKTESGYDILFISGRFDDNFKTEYKIGEKLDLTGLTVLVTYSDLSTDTLMPSQCEVSGFSSETQGTKTIEITYRECSFTFDVEVTE